MPLLIKTKVGLSEISGLGLFSEEDIVAGSVVWKHCEILDGWIPSQEINPIKTHAEHFLCYDNQLNCYIRACDNVNWINHSENPNLDSPNKYIHYAKKNINKGEELTLDYKQICDIVAKNGIDF